MNVRTVLSHFFATRVYRATFGYLLAQLYRLFRWEFLRILSLSFLAAGAQVGALLLIINTVNVLAAGGKVELYGFSMVVTPSMNVVVGLATLTVVLILIATTAMYASRVRTARMMINFHAHLERNVYLGVAAIVREPADSPSAGLLDSSDVTSMIGKDGRFAGRVINEISTSAVPVAAVLLIVPILFYLDALLFSMLALILASSLGVYGWVGRKAAGVSIAMEERGPPASRSKMAVLRAIRSLGPEPDGVHAMADELRANQDVKRFEEAYGNRLTMPHIGNSVGSIFLALTSFVVLVYFGAQILSDAWNRSEGFLFILLFVYVLISIRNLGRSLTNANIFYPHLRRIVQFILQTQDLTDSKASASTATGGSLPRAMLERPLGYVPSSRTLDYLSLRDELATGLSTVFEPSQTDMVAHLDDLAVGPYGMDAWTGMLMTESLCGNSALRSQAVAAYPNPARWQAVNHFLEQQQQQGFDAAVWDALTVESQLVIASLGLIARGSSSLMIPVNYLTSLTAEEQAFINGLLPTLTIFYWQKNTKNFAEVGVTQVLNMTDEQAVLEPPGKKPRLANPKPVKTPKKRSQIVEPPDELLDEGLL